MRDKFRKFRGVATTGMTSALVMACGAEAEYSDNVQGAQDSDGIAIRQQDIKNGIRVSVKRGVARIRRPNDPPNSGCSAALLNSQWLITAAHCVDDGMVQLANSPVTLQAIYYGRSSDDGRGLIISHMEEMRAWIIPTYGCFQQSCSDWQDDIALVRRSSPWNHPLIDLHIDTTDYLRLNGGYESGSVLDLPIEAFGVGARSPSSSADGLLRKFGVTVKHAEKHYYYDLEGTRGFCGGDSGGPQIGVRHGVEMITGVNVAMSSGVCDVTCCAADGAKQYVARTNSRIGWISQVMNSQGVICTEANHYTLCF